METFRRFANTMRPITQNAKPLASTPNDLLKLVGERRSAGAALSTISTIVYHTSSGWAQLFREIPTLKSAFILINKVPVSCRENISSMNPP